MVVAVASDGVRLTFNRATDQVFTGRQPAMWKTSSWMLSGSRNTTTE